MNKYIKYLIIIIVFIIVFSIINYYYKPDAKTKIEDVLLENGFQRTSFENLYEKREKNKILSFSTSDYTYMLNIVDKDGDNTYTLDSSYSYKDNSLIYSYRINNKDYYNNLFKGNYDGEKFVCEKEFSNVELSNSDKKNICNLAETNIKLFYLEAKTLFKNYNFIEYMKKQERGEVYE